jgi:hypothetical protein
MSLPIGATTIIVALAVILAIGASRDWMANACMTRMMPSNSVGPPW